MIRDKLLVELHSLAQLRTLESEFVVSLKSLDDEDFRFLGESIDDSDYSVQEWLIALYEFYQWNVRTNSPRSIRFQTEYLNCCVQGSVQGGGKLLPLAELFLDYAKIYGVTGSL